MLETLFDAAYYLETNPDVAAAGYTEETAIDHYLEFGALEGRDPNPLFDTAIYLIQRPDVAAATEDGIIDPLSHYLSFGAGEDTAGVGGSDPNQFFDTATYLAANQDVALAGANPLAHYIAFGEDEMLAGIRAPLEKTVASGDDVNPDVAGIQQYVFDPAFYRDTYADVQAAVEAGVFDTYLEHYLHYGFDEGRLGFEQPVFAFELGDQSSDTPVVELALNSNSSTQTITVVDDTNSNGVADITGVEGQTDTLRLTGDTNVRIDFTSATGQIKRIDIDGDGTFEQGTDEANVLPKVNVANFEIIDAYARNPLNQTDADNNFLGNIEYDGTGFDGDGVSTDGNIFLGGLGADSALGGIGNDFLAGGGVADGVVGSDFLFGGRNADFFFASLSLFDFSDGNGLSLDGGSTSDDAAVGNNTPQDTDWLLLEAADDEEPVSIILGPLGEDLQSVTTRVGSFVSMKEIENVDASGNLYGFLDDFDVTIGELAGQVTHTPGEENTGIGATAQLFIDARGVNVDNILIGGYDNDQIFAGPGADLIMGGNLAYSANNPNIPNIPNDGVDELYGGLGDDDVVFETDGGIYEGGALANTDEGENDTLWITSQSLGADDEGDLTPSAVSGPDILTDGTLRFDLAAGLSGGLDNAAGYGGADENARTGSYTADQTNYSDEFLSEFGRAQVQDFENVNATGLGAIDFLAAGTNDPELNFANQQNFFGTDVDLDLRGTSGDNALYANTGDDALEGRGGDDSLMGGEGNDDFIVSLGQTGNASDNGDDLDIIHRLLDLDGDDIWDGTFGQDFGVDETIDIGASQLTVDFLTSDLSDENVAVVQFEITIGGTVFAVTDTDALQAAQSAEEVAAIVDAEFSALDADVSVTASGNAVVVTDAQGRDISDTLPEGFLVVVAIPNGSASTLATFDAAPELVSEDRLIFTAYEDRLDGERVDDDSTVGSSISLGDHNYAEDLVVSFADDGTRIAESQSYQIDLTNLADEDTVTISVNGVQYSLQVGVAIDGSQIPAETTDAFVTRMVGYINTFLDDDTAAGQLTASVVPLDGTDAEGLIISEVDFDGEETVFLTTPVVEIDDNQSTGEPPTATVTNLTSTEVFLYEFDGRDGNLNADNVVFWGNTETSRSVLETASADGGELKGSDAVVIHTTGVITDSDEGLDGDIVFNATVNTATGFPTANFAVHGDDQLFGADGDDDIQGGTGDDRIYGSRGTDTLDGGKDLYLVDGVIKVLNTAEAIATDADPDVISISRILQTEDGATLAGLTASLSTFADTLIFQQSDFGTVGAGGAEFTITLDADPAFPNGGSGVVAVSEGGVETGVTTFTNFENVRTVSGDGTLDGQGNDTLDVEALSDSTGGIRYFLTSDANAGLVDIDEDLDAGADMRDWTNFFKVDGVENVIGGDGEDVLFIDESEAGKTNSFLAGDGDDAVNYSFDVANPAGDDNVLNPAITVIVNGGGDDVDLVEMTGGLVGLDVAVDTLSSVETINLTDAAENPSLDDTLDVTNVVDAVVDFVEGEVRSGGSVVPGTNVEVVIGDMFDLEIVEADHEDTVIVSDDMPNSRIDADSDADLTFDSFLNIDLLDERGDDPVRLSVADLRAIPEGTDDTADQGDIPEAENIGLFTFNLAEDSDTVDYSNETGLIAAVVEFDEDTVSAGVSRVLVSDDNDADFTDGSNRVDVLSGVENVVASQGYSILDLTTATTGLIVRYNADDGPFDSVSELDRDVFRVRLSELETTNPFSSINFLEYRDAGNDDDVTQVATAWNAVEGNDQDNVIELTDRDSTEQHIFNLRGGENEVNYNELTRSIHLAIGLDDDATTGGENDAIVGLVTFSDGNNNPLPGGQADQISSYAASNAVSAGSLRIEASQDAEDAVSFDFGNITAKVFILGQVIDSSDVITVNIQGEPDSIELTGFEILEDDPLTDDIYDFEDLDRAFNNLTLVDGFGNDEDTIKVGNDAVDFEGAGDNEISLEVLNNEFNFDFDILDITGVTDDDLTVVGDTVAGRDIFNDGGDPETLILGDLDLVDTVQLFDVLALTNASEGDTFDLDLDATELQDGSDDTLIDFDFATDTLDASRIDDRDLTLTITGNAPGTLIGGEGDDSMSGGGGNDNLVGGPGADVLDGGNIAEVREFELDGILGTDGNDASFNFMGQGNLTLTEGADFVSGAGADAVGTALASLLDNNLAQATADFQAATASLAVIVDVTYSTATNLLTFTFEEGLNVTGAISLGFAANGDTGTFNISSETTTTEGSDGGSDAFVYQAVSDSQYDGDVDTVVEFESGSDVIDVTDLLAAFDPTGVAILDFDEATDNVTSVAAANALLTEDSGNLQAVFIADATPGSGTLIIDYDDDGEVSDGDLAVDISFDDPDRTTLQTVDIRAVLAGNNAPVANPDAATTDEHTAVGIDVLANDTDIDLDTLSVAGVGTGGTIGSVSFTTASVTYDPNGQFESLGVGATATDTFSYTVSDGNGGTDTATVTVTITGVNDAPVAANDTAFTDEDNAVTVDVLANDSDVDIGDTLSVISTTTPGNGVVVVNANNTLTYTPDANFNGFDSFEYTISDGNGGTDTATLELTVNPVNDAPFVVAEIADQMGLVGDPVSLDVSGNFDDVDTGPSGTLTFGATGLPAGLSIDAGTGVISGTLTTAQAAMDVTVTATDGGSPVLSTSDTFTFEVTAGIDIVGEAVDTNSNGIADVSGTAAADRFVFDLTAAEANTAAGGNTFEVLSFDELSDLVTFDLAAADEGIVADSLDDLDGVTLANGETIGVFSIPDGFAGGPRVNIVLGTDSQLPSGQPITLGITGLDDASMINIDIA